MVAGATGSRVMKLNTAMQYLTESSRFAGEPSQDASTIPALYFLFLRESPPSYLVSFLWIFGTAQVQLHSNCLSV